MLKLEAVEKVYRTDRIETVALSPVNLEVKAGEFVAVMGPSGSGKSTLLNLMGLLDAPSKGRVVLDVSGEERSKMDVPDLLHMFEKVRGEKLADDALLLS